MGTYWDDFITEYKEHIAWMPLNKILEAFWYYSRDVDTKRNREVAESIITGINSDRGQ